MYEHMSQTDPFETFLESSRSRAVYRQSKFCSLWKHGQKLEKYIESYDDRNLYTLPLIEPTEYSTMVVPCILSLSNKTNKGRWDEKTNESRKKEKVIRSFIFEMIQISGSPGQCSS